MPNSRVFISSPGYSADDRESGERLRAAGYDLILRPRTGNRTAEELAALLDGAVAAIASTDPFTAEVLAANPDLRIIARTGVGADSIDQAAALRHGVAIALTPGMNTESVSDQTLAMILAMARKIVRHDTSVKAGGWARVGEYMPIDLGGMTVGLVGAGAIGRAVLRRLSGFGVRAIYFDPMIADVPDAVRVASLDALLGEADIVSLHVPLNDATRNLINDRAIGRMKRTAFLVNTARGGLVDEAALFRALREGRLAGAALDVFDREPPGAEHLADVPNLLCSAHIAGLGDVTLHRMCVSATASVLAVLRGEIPDTVINPAAIHARRAK